MQALTAFPFTSELTYDSTGWPQLDRAVSAEVLRRCLSNYFTNGVFLTANANCFKVSAPTGGSATVIVSAGVCLINGATGYIDDATTIELPAGDTSPRIDTVVLRLNDNLDHRNVYIDIIKGTPASNPVAPKLTQTDSIWEIGLANIKRAANSSTVTGSAITDTRADSSRCGQVNAIAKIDTKALMQQLNAYYDEFVAKCENDYNTSRATYTAQCEEILRNIQAFETSAENNFTEWFEGIRDILDESAAGHLQNEIDAAKADIESKKTEIEAEMDTLRSDVQATQASMRQDMDQLKKTAGGARFTLKFNFNTANSPTFANCKYTLTVGSTTRTGTFSQSKTSVQETGILTVGTATLTVTYDATVSGNKVSKTEKAKVSAPYYGNFALSVTLAGTPPTPPQLDYVGWLGSIGKSASGYASTSAVLADEKLVRELMTRHASANYLVANYTDKDIPLFTGSRLAVKWIGLRAYVYNKLMAIPVWKTALQASTYKSYIATAPTDTSEWEFGDSTIDMIYDNGVELKPISIGYRSGYADERSKCVLKTSDNIKLTKQVSTGSWILTGWYGDTTPYKSFIAELRNKTSGIDVIANAAAYSPSTGTTGDSSVGSNGVNSYTGATDSATASIPKQKFELNMQSINGNYIVGSFFVNSRNGVVGGTENIVQLYLKK